MRRILAAAALLMAACGPARDHVDVPPTSTLPPDTWGPLGDEAPHIDDIPPPPPDQLPPATVDETATTAPVVTDVFDQAMAVVVMAYNWPTVLAGWQVQRLDARDGLLALTYVLEHRIEVYPRAGEDVEQQAYIIAHELGHALDIERMSPFERAVWASNRGYGWLDWFPRQGVSDFRSGAGDFAEAFAYTLVPCGRCWRSDLGDPPTAGERDLLGALIR